MGERWAHHNVGHRYPASDPCRHGSPCIRLAGIALLNYDTLAEIATFESRSDVVG